MKKPAGRVRRVAKAAEAVLAERMREAFEHAIAGESGVGIEETKRAVAAVFREVWHRSSLAETCRRRAEDALRMAFADLVEAETRKMRSTISAWLRQIVGEHVDRAEHLSRVRKEVRELFATGLRPPKYLIAGQGDDYRPEYCAVPERFTEDGRDGSRVGYYCPKCESCVTIRHSLTLVVWRDGQAVCKQCRGALLEIVSSEGLFDHGEPR